MTLGTYTFKHSNDRQTPIHVLTHKGREVWIAQELGAALGYANPTDLSKKVGSEWADEFAAERDFFKVEGEELTILRGLVGAKLAPANDPAPPISDPANEPIISPMARSLLLLTESGVNLACTLARTPAARLFRRWLADEVLPSIRRTGGYSAPRGPQRGGKTDPQGELFQAHALAPFTPTAAPHVAFKALGILRREGRISASHHHNQLAQLTSRITGMEVKLLPPMMEGSRASAEDGVAAFLRERCAKDATADTPIAQLHATYERYCAERGYPCANVMSLGHTLSRLGFVARPRRMIGERQHRCVRGLRLLPEVIDITPLPC